MFWLHRSMNPEWAGEKMVPHSPDLLSLISLYLKHPLCALGSPTSAPPLTGTSLSRAWALLFSPSLSMLVCVCSVLPHSLEEILKIKSLLEWRSHSLHRLSDSLMLRGQCQGSKVSWLGFQFYHHKHPSDWGGV